MAFHAREPLLGELERNGWLNRLQALRRRSTSSGSRSTTTPSAPYMQAQVHAALDEALDRG